MIFIEFHYSVDSTSKLDMSLELRPLSIILLHQMINELTANLVSKWIMLV
jgi:hypothetical protein